MLRVEPWTSARAIWAFNYWDTFPALVPYFLRKSLLQNLSSLVLFVWITSTLCLHLPSAEATDTYLCAWIVHRCLGFKVKYTCLLSRYLTKWAISSGPQSCIVRQLSLFELFGSLEDLTHRTVVWCILELKIMRFLSSELTTHQPLPQECLLKTTRHLVWLLEKIIVSWGKE